LRDGRVRITHEKTENLFMAGLVIATTPKRVVDFSGLTSGSTQDFILADRVPILHWRELTAVVRVHSLNIGAGVGQINIYAAQQSWTPEDPGLPFLTNAASWVLATALSSTTQTPGSVAAPLTMGGSNCLGAMTRLIARGNRTAAGSLNATITVEIVAKDV
jgi:hypothetical protein